MTEKEKELYLKFINYCLDYYKDHPDGTIPFEESGYEFRGICALLGNFNFYNNSELDEIKLLKSFLNQKLPPRSYRYNAYCFEKSERGIEKRIEWLKRQKEELLRKNQINNTMKKAEWIKKSLQGSENLHIECSDCNIKLISNKDNPFVPYRCPRCHNIMYNAERIRNNIQTWRVLYKDDLCTLIACNGCNRRVKIDIGESLPSKCYCIYHKCDCICDKCNCMR